MRITAQNTGLSGKTVKTYALNEKVSVSSLIAKALEDFIEQKKKKYLGDQVLKIAGKIHASEDVIEELERGRLVT